MAEVKRIPVSDLHVDPMNVRSDPQVTKEFINSIESGGILQPLIVRPTEDGYGVVVGGRRYVAAVNAGLDEIPCEVRELSDDEAREISLVENWMRKDLAKGDSERAVYEAYIAGLESGVYGSQSDMARKTGISKSTISGIVRRMEESEEMSVDASTDSDLSYFDYHETRPLKNEPEVRRQLLEKRAEDRIRAEDLREISKTLADSSERARQEILSKEMISPNEAETISMVYADEDEEQTIPVEKEATGVTVTFGESLSTKLVEYGVDVGKEPEKAAKDLIEEALEAKGYG